MVIMLIATTALKKKMEKTAYFFLLRKSLKVLELTEVVNVDISSARVEPSVKFCGLVVNFSKFGALAT